MQSKTRQAALRVREAFLALPDDVLLAKIPAWLAVLDPDGEGWEQTPEYLTMLGYQVQSRATGAIYPSLDDLFDAEEEADDWATIAPSPATSRRVVGDLAAGDVYHGLVAFLGEVLPSDHTLTLAWGEAPGTFDDRPGGYAFMRYAAVYLWALAGQADRRAPREGKLISQQDMAALRGFLASEDGYDLPFDDAWSDDPWDAPPAPPVVCMCGGTFRLAERWLVAAGADVALNLAALRENGRMCDCLTVQVEADWSGPELRPPEPEWDPFSRPKKKQKPSNQHHKKGRR